MESVDFKLPSGLKVEKILYANDATQRAFYLVYSPNLNLRYGLKKISVQSPVEAKSVRNEIVALNRLPFGMSPKCHRYWQEGNNHLLLTDWIEGKPLSEEYPTPPVDDYDLARRLAVAEKLAFKLNDLHRHKLVHRDIKPENVIVQHRGQNIHSVALIDFGLTNQSRVGEEGTPLFQSPEQNTARYNAIAATSDIYSLCQLIHWLVKGEVYRLELNRRQNGWESDFLFELPELCDKEVSQLLQKGLAFDPRKRTKQAIQIGQALKQINRKISSRMRR